MRYFRYSISRRDSNGNIVKGTRTDKGIGDLGFQMFASEDEVDYVRATQAVITDTITGVTLVEEMSLDTDFQGNFGTAGGTDSVWAEVTNLKLINSFTDGDNTYKTTLNRPATAATEQQLKAQAVAAAELSTLSSANAISGYYTGSTVSTAWQND